MIPHPSTLTALAGQRRAEHLAEADRYRLAQRAIGKSSGHRDWTAVVAVALALALPVLASLSG